jgi:hypothetical protein
VEQTAALRQTRDQLALQRAVQGPRQSLGTLNPTALNDKTDSRAVSTEIDASALSHHEVTAGVPSQQADTTFDASYVIEPKAHDEMGDSSDSDSGNPRAAKRKRKNKLQLREEARLREIIMHQLLTQTLERAKREKLLRMLAALGMTEQEYRSFLTRLHAADAKREEAAKIQEAHKIALAVEVPPQSAAPTMKPDAPKSVSSDGSSPRTRAELFARLRNQREDKVH